MKIGVEFYKIVISLYDCHVFDKDFDCFLVISFVIYNS